jgi:diguanylate cyclase (GGDEF)-like protein/PAS domain S-box-containing protein
MSPKETEISSNSLQQVPQSEEQLRNIIEYAPTGIVTVSIEGILLQVNPSYCEITGYTKEELIGMDYRSLTLEDDLVVDNYYVQKLFDGGINSYKLEKRYIRKNKNIIWVQVTRSLVRDPATNKPLYYIAQVENITTRKEAEKAFRAQQFVDEIAASVALIGHDGKGALIITACNRSFLNMTGGQSSNLGDFPVPFDALLPSYARHEFRAILEKCFTTGIAQELEQAYDLRDGTHWWRLSLKPFRRTDEGSQVVEILITGLEITQKMELMHELEVSTSRFRSVVDAAYDAIVTIDQEHNITLFNRAAENLFGYDAEEVIGKPLLQLIPEQYRPNHDQYVNQFARSPVRSREMNERNSIYGRHRDGSLLPVEIAISKINVGGLLEFTAIVRDVEDRARLMNLLKKEAVTDQLTGLPNRREFLNVVENTLRTGEILSVFMLDIDLFKKVNDTFGHDAGDEVLSVLAQVGTGMCRKMDVFARWGGEEFIMALPATDLESARDMAEKLRVKIEAQDFVHSWHANRVIPFTVSVGVTTSAPGEQDVETIIKRADEALYKAKESGRNRVVVYQKGM